MVQWAASESSIADWPPSSGGVGIGFTTLYRDRLSALVQAQISRL